MKYISLVALLFSIYAFIFFLYRYFKLGNKKRLYFSIVTFLTILGYCYLSYHYWFDDKNSDINLLEFQISENLKLKKLVEEQNILISQLSSKYDTLQTKIDNPKMIIPLKIESIDNKVILLNEELSSLKSAINPSKPEEHLRVVRLQDKLYDLENEFNEFQISIKSRQESFEKTIIRELDNRDKFILYFFLPILLVLIPLSIPFIKDNFQSKKKKDK